MQNDLISRMGLMKKIAHHTVHDSMSIVTFERSTIYEMVKGDMFSLVKDAPTVDAVPVVHGRWIRPVPGDGSPYCSVCKHDAIYSGGWFGDNYKMTKFCPNCGAKMDAKK